MRATSAADRSDRVAIMFVKAELLTSYAYSSGGITTVIHINIQSTIHHTSFKRIVVKCTRDVFKVEGIGMHNLTHLTFLCAIWIKLSIKYYVLLAIMSEKKTAKIIEQNSMQLCTIS